MTAPIASARTRLIQLLRSAPGDPQIPELLMQVELEGGVDLTKDVAALEGVWELRWSSSSQPWLKQAPWLDNLQVLDPVNRRGMNLLRLSGPIGALAAVAVQADLAIDGPTRVSVQFRRGGWIGPALPGGWRPKLLARVNQTFPAWLEITALDQQLRICRGNAGTCFTLLRRNDLKIKDLMPEQG